MRILDNLIIVSLLVICFLAGMRLANWYNDRNARDVKSALEKQFLRLQTGSDADDPCRPYCPQPISPQFMAELKSNGRAKTKFRKSDFK